MKFNTKHEIATLFVLAEKALADEGKRGFFGKDKGTQSFEMMMAQLDRTIAIAKSNSDLVDIKFPTIMNLFDRAQKDVRVNDSASELLARVAAYRCGIDYEQMMSAQREKEVNEAIENLAEYSIALAENNERRIEFWGGHKAAAYAMLAKHGITDAQAKRLVAEEIKATTEEVEDDDEDDDEGIIADAIDTLAFAKMDLNDNRDIDTSTDGQMRALRLLRENGYKANDIDDAVARAEKAITEAAHRYLRDNDPDYAAKRQAEADEEVADKIEIIALVKARVELTGEEMDEENRGDVFDAMLALNEHDISATEIDLRVGARIKELVSEKQAQRVESAEKAISSCIELLAMIHAMPKQSRVVTPKENEMEAGAVETLEKYGSSYGEVRDRILARVDEILAEDRERWLADNPGGDYEATMKMGREAIDKHVLTLAKGRRDVQEANCSKASTDRLMPGTETDVLTPEGKHAREFLQSVYADEEIEILVADAKGELWFAEARESARVSQEAYWGTSAHEAFELTAEQRKSLHCVGHFPPMPEGTPPFATTVDFTFYIDPAKTAKALES